MELPDEVIEGADTGANRDVLTNDAFDCSLLDPAVMEITVLENSTSNDQSLSNPNPDV